MNADKLLYVNDRKTWRAWLEKHHQTVSEIWLIYYKKGSGRPRIPYEDAVEEALCFGWIDSLVKRLDEARYLQKFTPRRASSNWSQSNLRRARKLVREGRMTEAGLACARAALRAGTAAPAPKPMPTTKSRTTLPPEFRTALQARPAAWKNFRAFAPGYQRNYIHWITTAKREATRTRRIAEAVRLAAQNVKALLK